MSLDLDNAQLEIIAADRTRHRIPLVSLREWLLVETTKTAVEKTGETLVAESKE